jgi:hypothetical protein
MLLGLVCLVLDVAIPPFDMVSLLIFPGNFVTIWMGYELAKYRRAP